MTTPDRKFTKHVATEIERRRRRRKLFFLVVWGLLIALAIVYARCGRGWGIGGEGKGKGTGSATPGASDAGPTRCTVRVTADGIFVDGNPMKRDEAVVACKKTEGAMVTVTGDARQGDWEELRAALQAVRVKIYIRGEVGDFLDCESNPQAKGCGN